jgi:SAM-dependent methyltransferase/methyltransferase-like protein
MDSYDQIPYDSTPFTDTHPGTLAVLGRLFGLETPDPELCRVLELGCASGGNLIPLAWQLPGAECLGVELSAGQAAAGQALIRDLGLTNARILQADILDLGENLGEFDYILCHGVYSWVPAPVQERILDLAGRHLSPGGVAYLSYNTLPGWRMRGMLRDMLLFHVREERAPRRRLDLAYGFLEALDRALDGLAALSARYLRHEIDYLRKAHPSYVYHEYLEEANEPLLFTDFMRRASAHGLQYLCDAELHTMFASTLGDGAAAMVGQFEDLLTQEQYQDFVRNRNFRQSLLCRAECTLSREISLQDLDRYACYGLLEPAKSPDLRRAREQPYRAAAGTQLSVSHPLTRAALIELAQVYPDSTPMPELRAAARRRVLAAGGQSLAEQDDHLAGELFSLFAHGGVGLSLAPRRFFRELQERPRAHRLARAQAARGLGHLATARHATLNLDPFAVRFVGHLDGTRDLAELTRTMLQEVRRGLPGVTAEGRPERLESQVRANCERLLGLFARHGVLEPAA